MAKGKTEFKNSPHKTGVKPTNINKKESVRTVNKTEAKPLKSEIKPTKKEPVNFSSNAEERRYISQKKSLSRRERILKRQGKL